MVINGLTVQNCERGVVFAEYTRTKLFGQLNVIRADIDATEALVVEGLRAKVSLTSSVVRRGSWPSVTADTSSAAVEAWRMDLYIFSGHNLNNYTIGHVKNQLHFGNMNYCGLTGIHVVAEETGLAEVTVWGQNTDCCTVSMNIEAAARVDFISLQTTAFTWDADRQEAEMNLIHLGADCDATVNVFGAALYENPDYMFDVENGTLNVFGATYKSSSPMTNLGVNGHVNLVDMYIGAYQSIFDGLPAATEITPATAYSENLSLTHSFYYVPLADTETMVNYHHVYKAAYDFRQDVAENMILPTDSEVLFSEAFTDYAAAREGNKLTVVGSTVTVQDGVATLQNSGSVTQTGLSALGKMNLSDGGIYRAELRFKANVLRTAF